MFQRKEDPFERNRIHHTKSTSHLHTALALRICTNKRLHRKDQVCSGRSFHPEKSQSNWNPLRIGIKVKPVDLIRTLVESEAGIALKDGSLITIEENTTIHFEGAEASTKPGTSIKIKSGRVFFDVQKQTQGKAFQFKTETATAAIRGTNGFIEQTQKGIIASLETGKWS